MSLQDAAGFSIIIPTYREVDNLAALAKRLASVDFHAQSFEVLLMDDNSQDGSVELVNQLRVNYPWLRLIVRQGRRDLSQSIMDGFQMARYPIVLTMDADLSHPPEAIPAMLSVLENEVVDMVIGSRYMDGGSSDVKWPLHRRLISRAAALSASLLLLSKVYDPLSGFIAFRKSLLEKGDALSPIGWKLGLEIMIKCRCRQIREIPIHFSQRYRGSSKLNLKISFDYLRHLFHLGCYKLTNAGR
jgi:dolichol-phosphate mannosyltransferase